MPLISTKRKAVILRPRNPEQIKLVIPHAKEFEFQGKHLLAVPHRLEETKVLRNLGHDVPEPVRFYYDWPAPIGRKPFHAQTETVAFLTMHERAFVLSSMGTGKTQGAIWAAHYLMELGLVNRVLVVAPLSTLERTWADSIFSALPDRVVHVLHGSRDRRMRLLRDRDASFYVINTDGVNIVRDALKERPDIDLIIVDEGALYRNQQTDRWKSLNVIVNKQHKRRCWWMTGTPTPNEPTDAFAQAKIVVPHKVPGYYGAFRSRVMNQVTQWKWVPRPNANEIVREILQPAIRFSLEDCQDLPPTIHATRDVPLTPEQAAAYKTMMSRLHAELASGELTAANEAIKTSKLFQIGMGVAYDGEGGVVDLPCQPRLDEVMELVGQAEGKAIVFVPFKGALARVAAHLATQYTVRTVSGDTTKNERDEAFGDFQKRTDPHVLVMNPAVAAHGLTLTAATVIIWYGPITSNEIYEQACARVRRPGQTRTTLVVHICGSEAERRQYARLQGKGAMQGSLLDLIKEAA